MRHGTGASNFDDAWRCRRPGRDARHHPGGQRTESARAWGWCVKRHGKESLLPSEDAADDGSGGRTREHDSGIAPGGGE